MKINRRKYIAGETRYEVDILTTYKAQIPLLRREFIWAPNLCDCPRLRTRKTYVIMGFVQRHQDRELKLIVNPWAYVRRYSRKQNSRMLKLQSIVKC